MNDPRGRVWMALNSKGKEAGMRELKGFLIKEQVPNRQRDMLRLKGFSREALGV